MLRLLNPFTDVLIFFWFGNLFQREFKGDRFASAPVLKNFNKAVLMIMRAKKSGRSMVSHFACHMGFWFDMMAGVRLTRY